MDPVPTCDNICNKELVCGPEGMKTVNYKFFIKAYCHELVFRYMSTSQFFLFCFLSLESCFQRKTTFNSKLNYLRLNKDLTKSNFSIV